MTGVRLAVLPLSCPHVGRGDTRWGTAARQHTGHARALQPTARAAAQRPAGQAPACPGPSRPRTQACEGETGLALTVPIL